MKFIGIAMIMSGSLACAATSTWNASVSPGSGGGEDGRFVFAVSHTGGSSQIKSIELLFQTPSSGQPASTGACHLTYVPPTKTVTLYQAPAPGTLAPAADDNEPTVANAQCSVSNLAIGTITNGYSIGVNIVFRTTRTFRDGLKVWARTTDSKVSAWVDTKATWTIKDESARANPRLGLHLLYLSDYSEISLSNAIFALTTGDAPATIQIAFCPAYYSKNGASNPDAWNNARWMASQLTAHGISATFAVMMSAHAKTTAINSSEGTDKSKPNDADVDPTRVYDNGLSNLAAFMHDVAPAKVVVIPSNEDELTNDSFINLANAVLGKLVADGVQTDVTVRRSIDPAHYTDADNNWKDLSNNCGKIASGKLKHTTCQFEVHGKRSETADAYSNDGLAVYNDQANLLFRENSNAFPNAGTIDKLNYTKQTLSEFAGAAAYKSGPVTLLWRPAFNLWKAVDHTNGSRTFTQPASNPANPGSLRDRADPNGDYAIGAYEIQVIQAFFRLAPTK